MFARFSSGFARTASAASNWMDGSLILRAIMWLMDGIKRIAMGSFIVLWFVGSPKKPHGFFADIARFLERIIPKPLGNPKSLPAYVSNTLHGSAILRTILRGSADDIPPAGASNVSDVLMWLGFVAPGVILAGVVFLAPVAPTLLLGGSLGAAILLLLLSRSLVVDRLFVAISLFVLANMFSGVTALGGGASLNIALLTSIFVCAAVFIPAAVMGKQNLHFFLLVFLGGAAITAAVGFWQIFAGYITPAWIDADAFTDIDLRVFSTLGNPNVYGTYLLLAIPIAAASAVYFKHPFLKLLCAGLAAALVLNLLATYSRGCYLALAVAAGIFVLIIRKRLVVLFVPVVAAMPIFLPDAVMNRFFSILDFSNPDTSTIHRLSIWRGSVRVLFDFWPVGIGQGTGAFTNVYPYYSLAGAVAAHSHNLFLQIALELGIVGFLAFVFVLAAFFSIMANFIASQMELRLRIMAAAFVCAIIGLLVQGMFDHALYNFSVMLSFFVVIGLGAAFVYVHSGGESVGNNTYSDTPTKAN